MSPRIGLDLPTLLQAAAAIADTEGLDEVTLASLAQKLHIRSPSLYNHVEGLQGLRTKLAIYGLRQLNECLVQALEGRTGDAAIRALGKTYVAFARSHPGLYEATLRAPDASDPEYRTAGEALVGLVQHALLEYGLEGDAAVHTVRGIRSLLHGFASLEQKGGFGLPLDLDHSLEQLIDTFLAGIRSMRANGQPIP